jgi:hypothetical protein
MCEIYLNNEKNIKKFTYVVGNFFSFLFIFRGGRKNVIPSIIAIIITIIIILKVTW